MVLLSTMKCSGVEKGGDESGVSSKKKAKIRVFQRIDEKYEKNCSILVKSRCVASTDT